MKEHAFYSIVAGGAFGSRRAIYQEVEGRLVIRDEGDHDNLVGNDLAASFEGYTLDQAKNEIEALNSEGSGHSYDGCHACTWSISIRQLDKSDIPAHLTHSKPKEAKIIRQVLEAYRNKC